jgi:multidrug transporter EmrE-like cation transporter
MKTAIVLIVAIIAQAAGDVLVTRGMKGIAAGAAPTVESAGLFDRVTGYLRLGADVAASPEVLFGTLLLIVFFLLYSAALSWADLSFVLPATAFGYVLNVAAGHYFLDETVTPSRWAGALIITLGVFFVSRSGHNTVQPETVGETE